MEMVARGIAGTRFPLCPVRTGVGTFHGRFRLFGARVRHSLPISHAFLPKQARCQSLEKPPGNWMSHRNRLTGNDLCRRFFSASLARPNRATVVIFGTIPKLLILAAIGIRIIMRIAALCARTIQSPSAKRGAFSLAWRSGSEMRKRKRQRWKLAGVSKSNKPQLQSCRGLISRLGPQVAGKWNPAPGGAGTGPRSSPRRERAAPADQTGDATASRTTPGRCRRTRGQTVPIPFSRPC